MCLFTNPSYPSEGHIGGDNHSPIIDKEHKARYQRFKNLSSYIHGDLFILRCIIVHIRSHVFNFILHTAETEKHNAWYWVCSHVYYPTMLMLYLLVPCFLQRMVMKRFDVCYSCRPIVAISRSLHCQIALLWCNQMVMYIPYISTYIQDDSW